MSLWLKPCKEDFELPFKALHVHQPLQGLTIKVYGPNCKLIYQHNLESLYDDRERKRIFTSTVNRIIIQALKTKGK